MRPLIVAALAMVVATGACWFPDKTYLQSDAPPPPPDTLVPDAQQGPLACNNMPLPPVKSMNTTVKGTVTLAFSGDPAMAVTVQAFLNTPNPGSQGELQRTTTDDKGMFTIQLDTGGGRVDAYLKVTASGFLDNYFYSAYPVGGDTVQLDLRLFKQTELTTLTSGMGVTVNPGEAVFLVAAVDCNEKPLGGVTVTTDPPGDQTQVHYFIDHPSLMPSMSAKFTDGTTGVGIAANIPIATTTIGGSLLSPTDPGRTLTMYSHPIYHPVSGALIQTELGP